MLLRSKSSGARTFHEIYYYHILLARALMATELVSVGFDTNFQACACMSLVLG